MSSSRYSAFVSQGGPTPSSSKSTRKNPSGSSLGLKMNAEFVLLSSWPSSACNSVVSPVPTSPVSMTKPLPEFTA
ncbi:MAG: hypothetical protein R3E53_18970 [Myxococcota bacterium]